MKAWEKNIRMVDPYVPGEQPVLDDMIKLNTNENPYPPAPGVKEIIDQMNVKEVRLYPDPSCSSLVNVLSEYYQLEKDQVFVGVGSDDVLATAFLTFFNSKKPILFPDITYAFYDVWANLYHIPFERPALDENFRIKREDYYKENGGVVIANPNAPTSICEGLEFIEDILNHNQDVIVIVDEAYVDFGGVSARPLLKKYDNLLITQTFSKSRSMAGARIGYCMGSKRLIQAMNDVKYSINSYTMNQWALRIGVEAVKDDVYFKEGLVKIMRTRQATMSALRELGFEVMDSKTNFLFITHKHMDCKQLFEYLRTKHIFVRRWDADRISNYLRVTIGTEQEMATFLDETRKFIQMAQQAVGVQ
ncbi:MAG: histidinol-phosphate transaminase [bacterium]|nr:histidinol-phosphate transaminase [bacterium]